MSIHPDYRAGLARLLNGYDEIELIAAADTSARENGNGLDWQPVFSIPSKAR